MRAPLSWLREYADLPATAHGRELAERLTMLGFEVETVHTPGADIAGPLIIGRVISFEEEEHSNGKTIRWVSVDVGEPEPRGIVCGARNFAADDLVVVALPGATLPGGFSIGARTTYGHVSDGMICSARELGTGDDHTGILVIPAGPEVGADAAQALGLRDEVLDIAITPDRAYALSIRGLAREAATAYGVAFRDPADVGLPQDPEPGHPVEIADPTGADRIVLRTVTGLDPTAASPWWLQRRLVQCGMRPVSLAVDVTNYLMLELGQPLHAFDRARVDGPVVVRRAAPGETLETLDHLNRTLDPEDLLIADDRGPIGLAGTMGGLATEIGPGSTELVIEAAHFLPVPISRMARRHKLPSEASKRFERGVDPELGPVASARAVALLTELGGARYVGSSEADLGRPPSTIALDPARPGRTAGIEITGETVRANLAQVGCTVSDDSAGGLLVTPPTWRPDITDPADLDEEVIRLVGYDSIPSVLPAAPAGRGFTDAQRLRRRIGTALAYAGLVEAPSYPFVAEADLDALLLPPGDPRRNALRLANPLSDEEPLLRTTLLPGLLHALRRNIGRGAADQGLFEVAPVFRPRRQDGGSAPTAPRPPLDRRPADSEVQALDAALPEQPWRVAVVISGHRELAGWWGPGRSASWADAVHAARLVAAEARVALDLAADRHAPWHPGRCAALCVDGRTVGHAGELHPRVVAALGLPERTVAMELDLELLGADGSPVLAPRLSTQPVATQDVALVVDATVPAADVEKALRDGAGALLESVRLFDVYRGEQVGEGKASLAYSLRFRAPDRTLTVDEASAAREAAVAEAARRVGAELRH